MRMKPPYVIRGAQSGSADAWWDEVRGYRLWSFVSPATALHYSSLIVARLEAQRLAGRYPRLTVTVEPAP